MKPIGRGEGRRGPATSRNSTPPILRIAATCDKAGANEPWVDSLLETSCGAVLVRQSAGRGLPLLLLHDASGGKDAFRHQFSAAVGAKYRLIAIDLPRHGASVRTADPDPAMLARKAAELSVEILEALGIDDAALLGWGTGGQVAFDMTTRFPGAIGIMLSGTSRLEIARRMERGRSNSARYLALMSKAPLSGDELLELQQVLSGGFAGGLDHRAPPGPFEALLNEFASDQNPEADTALVPLAIVNGADDPLVGVDATGGRAHETLWGGRCWSIPKAGHAPFIDQPDVFNALLERFLRDMDLRLAARRDDASLCFSG